MLPPNGRPILGESIAADDYRTRGDRCGEPLEDGKDAASKAYLECSPPKWGRVLTRVIIEHGATGACEPLEDGKDAASKAYLECSPPVPEARKG
jgi:hypothetical protein